MAMVTKRWSSRCTTSATAIVSWLRLDIYLDEYEREHGDYSGKLLDWLGWP